MIPPKFQIATILMFILFLLILIMAAVDHYYWILLIPYAALAYDIYIRKY